MKRILRTISKTVWNALVPFATAIEPFLFFIAGAICMFSVLDLIYSLVAGLKYSGIQGLPVQPSVILLFCAMIIILLYSYNRINGRVFNKQAGRKIIGAFLALSLILITSCGLAYDIWFSRSIGFSKAILSNISVEGKTFLTLMCINTGLLVPIIMLYEKLVKAKHTD
jgi:hypothetical protein